MSTYPATLDDLGATNPAGTDTMLDGDGHAAQHADANDAIDAIQTTLGVDPQGGSTDVATRLDDLAFTDLADVDMSGIANGDVPVWNSGSSKFEPGSGGGGGGGDLVKIATGTFSASSGFSVNSCFSSTYDDYKIILVCTGTTDVLVALRLRLSGTDSSTGYYSERVFGYSSTPGAAPNTTGTDDVNIGIGSNGAKISTSIEMHDPGTAVYMSFEAIANSHFSSVGRLSHVFTGGHDVATAYDGFSVIPDAGTLTGRYAVYGYAK